MQHGKKSRNRNGAYDPRQYCAILRFLASHLANEQDARELTQEAYLRLLRASKSKLIDDPAAYLFRIAQNLLYEWYTSRPPQIDPLEVESLVSDPADVENTAALAQQMDRLEAILQQLSPNCRAAIVMNRRDGMTYKEIGSLLGVSSAMVKKYLSQGLARCRRELHRFQDY